MIERQTKETKQKHSANGKVTVAGLQFGNWVTWVWKMLGRPTFTGSQRL